MRLLRERQMGLVIGALAAAFALEVIFLASALGLVPFAPFALALAVVDVTPGPLASTLIDLLQFWAKRLVEGGVLVAAVGFGAVGGALAQGSAARSRALAVAAIPWALDVVAAAVFASRQFDPLRTAIAAALGVVVYAAGLRWMSRALATPAVIRPGRRQALVGLGVLALIVGSSGMLLASLGRRTAAVARALVLPKDPAVRAPAFAPEDPAFEATAGLTPQLTSNEDFYVVDTALFKPTVDVSGWRLRVDGLVERPFQLTYDELLAMDAIEQVQTLECISNPVGGDLISTAKWTGVRLVDLIRRAGGLKPGAFDLVMTSVDAYSDSVPIAKALEPTTLLAYGMNDEVLPVDHGFPARMLIPDIYGMKNVKWVERITVADFDYRGYWQDRGWSDVAVVVTNARIDVPQRTVKWSGGAVRTAGVAFAGARGIQKVEISLDQGRTWRDAVLGREVNPFTWRRWYYEWTPEGPGQVRLMVRAVDGKGVSQSSAPREPFPQGATGYHVVFVEIQKT